MDTIDARMIIEAAMEGFVRRLFPGRYASDKEFQAIRDIWSQFAADGYSYWVLNKTLAIIHAMEDLERLSLGVGLQLNSQLAGKIVVGWAAIWIDDFQKKGRTNDGQLFKAEPPASFDHTRFLPKDGAQLPERPD